MQKEFGTRTAQVENEGQPILYGELDLFQKERDLIFQGRTVGAECIEARFAKGIESATVQGIQEAGSRGSYAVGGLEKELGVHPEGTVQRRGPVFMGPARQFTVKVEFIFAPSARKDGKPQLPSLLFAGGVMQKEFKWVCMRVASHNTQEYRLIVPSAKRTQPVFSPRRYSIQTACFTAGLLPEGMRRGGPMKRYCIKCESGRVEFLDILRELDDSYLVRVVRVKDGWEKVIEETMSKSLFETCINTGYLYEASEEATVVA